MVIHLVFWKMKPQADGRSGSENAKIAVQKLNALNGVVPSALAIEAGINFNSSPAAYDIGLCSRFNTKEDLDAYQKHSAHLHVAEWVANVTESRAVADFEI
ncbi:MAG: Dabb family protein [Fibromonadaceae bacterium]|jgi:hypothetical protein|nr:Dabb family protein [Fibromonadaceae bacterium]